MTWYARGVRFACQRCGNCCTGDGSVVRVSEREIEALALRVNLTPAAFIERHTREEHGARVLLDTGDLGDCEWLDRRPDGTSACRLQEAKPDQCASYPFWPRILASRGAWEAEGRSCTGIGAGPSIPAPDVERRLGKTAALERLDVLFEELDAEVRELGATCSLRGDCCDFPTAGHRLYTSRLEAERFARGVDLTEWDPESGLCPAWEDRKCTAREHRPVGCRVYFCDPAFEERVHDLMERTVTQLKWLHDRAGLPWSYRDVFAHLSELRPDAGVQTTDES